MAWLEKGILFYLLLAISVSFAAPEMIFNSGSPTDATILSWFNVKTDADGVPYYNTDGGYSFTGDAATAAGNMREAPAIPGGSTSGFFRFLDPVFQVFGFIGAFFKVLFSPVIILTRPEMVGAPPALLWIIGIPSVTMFIVGIIYWLRGGN